MLVPFESVYRAALTFTDSQVRSQLFAELAQNQLAAGQFDDALLAFSAIPLPQERRTALLTTDFSRLPAEKIEPLLQLLQSHPQTQSLAGSIALALLFAQNEQSAWKLVETAIIPFESDSQRYNFLQKVLSQTEDANWKRVLPLHQKFTDIIYKNWGTLAMITRLTQWQRADEAVVLVHSFVLPSHRSWAYWEMSRLAAAEQSDKFLDKAIEEIEAADVDPDKNEAEQDIDRETLAVQLRILGRAAFQRGKQEKGEQLLERSESFITRLSMPMQRFRQQCFLGKVLLELRLISSIQDYVPTRTMLTSLSTGLNRSKVLVWLAEAGWNKGWTQAVEALSAPERGVIESERAERIAAILKRYISQHQGLTASGDSMEDSLRISGEEFESYYFSPFSTADCRC